MLSKIDLIKNKSLKTKLTGIIFTLVILCLVLMISVIFIAKKETRKAKLAIDTERVYSMLREKEQRMNGAFIIENSREIMSIIKFIKERNDLLFINYFVGSSKIATFGNINDCAHLKVFHSKNPFLDGQESATHFCLNENIQEDMSTVYRIIVWSFLGFAVFSALAIRFFLESQVLKPINQIIKAARMDNDLAGVPVHQSTELNEIMSSISNLKTNLLSSKDAEIKSKEAEIASRELAIKSMESEYRTKELNKFSSDSAHNILPIVRSITSRSSQLESLLPTGLSKLLFESLNSIHTIGKRWLLLSKGSAVSNEFKSVFLNDFLEDFISTAIEIHKSKSDIEFKFIGIQPAFAIIEKQQFSEVLNNLVNNAVEEFALGNKKQGKITITLKSEDNSHSVSVQDNGRGIPIEVIDRLFEYCFSYGKPNGSGIALNQARRYVESWGGTMPKPTSGPEGTIFPIILPKQNAPAWFTYQMELHPEMEVFILDDEKVIHMNLEEKLKPYVEKYGLKIKSFYSPLEFTEFVTQNPNKNRLYLIDQFISRSKVENLTGLEIIEQMNISSQSILVTTAFDNVDIQQNALRLQMKILPKLLIWDSKIIMRNKRK